MQVILRQDIQSLGKTGEVLKVKEGYARNYLLPNNLAIMATEGNLKQIERQKVKQAYQYALQKKEARGLADKLSKVSCTVTVEVNDYEKLYGSVTESEIVKALEQEGHTIDKKMIVLEKSINELGIFEVGIRLHPEVMAKIRLWVTKK